MTATLVFHLPDEQAEFELASRAGQLASALGALDLEARNMLKYGHAKSADEVLRWIRSEVITPEIRSLIES